MYVASDESSPPNFPYLRLNHGLSEQARFYRAGFRRTKSIHGIKVGGGNQVTLHYVTCVHVLTLAKASFQLHFFSRVQKFVQSSRALEDS